MQTFNKGTGFCFYLFCYDYLHGRHSGWFALDPYINLPGEALILTIFKALKIYMVAHTSFIVGA